MIPDAASLIPAAMRDQGEIADKGEGVTRAGGDKESRRRHVLRRSFLGYKRADVVAALEEQRHQIARLADSVDRLYTERERMAPELADARAEVERMRLNEHLRVDRAESEARATAARIVADAEEEALRVRHAIGARIADGTTRLDELLRVREGLVGDLRAMLVDYDEALGRLDRGAEHPPAHEPPIRAERSQVSVVPDVGDGDVLQLFPRRIELHAGPFDDFTDLSAFERSLAGLPTIEDVYIRAFEAHRAVIELALAEERPLLSDLAMHVPYEISVASVKGETLNIDVRSRYIDVRSRSAVVV